MKYFFLNIILFFIAVSTYSQIIVTNNITIDDGLAYSEVTCAFKDYRGIFWLGTSSGLSEWNSVDFRNYYGEDGLPSRFVKSICEDKNNILYVATTEGLVFKNGEHFSYPSNLPDELKSRVNELYLSKNKKLYILTEKFGLWIKGNNKFYQVENDIKTKSFIPISILERRNGDILVGTRTGGVYQIINKQLKQIIYKPLYKKYPVVDLLELNKDSLYIALQGYGVLQYNAEKGLQTVLTRKNGLPSNQINDLELDSHNKLIVATTNGVARVFKNKVTNIISQRNGLKNEFILKIYPLNKRTFLFLSEGGGFYIYQENSLATYNKSSGLLHDNIWRINELKDGSLCFLTDEGISLLKNKKFRSITTKNGLGDNLVVSLYEAKNGDIYVSTYSDGVNLITNGNVKRLNKRVGMFENTTCTIAEYNRDTLFFITRSKGIAVYDGKRIIDTLGVAEGLPNLNILTSLRKNDGTILVSVAKDGVYKYDGNRFVRYFNDIRSCSIWAIYEDSYGNLYLGTNDKGLIKCYPNGLKDTVNVRKGMSNNCVVSIINDNNGNVYAGTDKGLSIIKFSDIGKFKVRQLFKQSGLAHSECNQGAIYKDKHGEIWVGTIGGVTRINPDINDVLESDTPIIFTSIKILDKAIIYNESIENLTLNYRDNDISFKFVGLNYLNPIVVNYRYKLENVDQNWTVNKNNEVRYSKLPSGSYKFIVATSNTWGIWSKPIHFSFEIKKPFWKMWWFVVSLFLLLVVIVYVVLNYRLKNILRLEKLRSKISADLHDEIGSGLSEISILSELLKYNKTFDQKLIDGLDKIGDSTRLLIKSLSDIIWIVDPREENIGDLINRIQNTYQEVFFQANINLKINNIEQITNFKLSLEIRQNLYLIIKEAVNNALKYSNCKNIFININMFNKKLVVEVIDDGIGLNEDAYAKGNGLFNMKRRAKTINAEFVIKSGKNGTKIETKIAIKGKGIKW